MRPVRIACLTFAGLVLAQAETVRFLRWNDVQPLIAAFNATADRFSEIKDAADWDSWIRARDFAVRGRIDHGIEDSMSELVLFGTSFPAPQRLASASEAVNAAGDLTPTARARVDAFVEALDELDTERLRLVLDFLRRSRVTQDELPAFLSGSVRRFALEEIGLPKNQSRADAGISPETSLLINFAVENVLRSLKTGGVLPAHIRRIAVVGPGLDLAGDPEVFDSGPLQSIQPFAILDSVLRLGCAQAPEVQLAALDMSPVVLTQLRGVLTKAKASQHYTLQLTRPAAGWSAAAVDYWQRFGESIGSSAPATATAPPGFEFRSIAVKPQLAARISVEDVDIIAQTMDPAAGSGFDLVLATNVFSYFSHKEQALALTSIAHMMQAGGILVVNGMPAALKLAEFEDLGKQHVSYSDKGTSGEDLLVFRRR